MRTAGEIEIMSVKTLLSRIVVVKYKMFAAAAESVTGTRIAYPIELTLMFPIETVGVAARASDNARTFTCSGNIGRNYDAADDDVVEINPGLVALSLRSNMMLYVPGLRSARYLIVNVIIVSV